MTQEQKAKAYDEAIERARKINSGDGVPAPPDWTTCEVIFPELKESKDEKIRKWLIYYFTEVCDNVSEKEKKIVLAWLEKQGEQKPTIEMKSAEESLGIDSDTYNKIVDECIYGGQKPVDADLKDIVDKEANSIWKEINTGGSHSIIDSFNQFYGIYMQVAEAVVDCKKPTEWIQELESKLSNATPEQLAEWKEKYFKVEPAWSEEDEKILKKSIKLFDEFGGDRESGAYTLQEMDCRNCADWLKFFKDRVKLQPVEWSEEDEAKLKSILFHIEDVENKDVIDWFKFLKYRVLPQPKQEWSEEDEYTLYETIQHLKELIRIDIAKYCGCDVQFYQRDIDWLKSLKDRYTWKPSEKQKEALLWCVVHLGGADKQTLGELLEELNKL